MKYSIGDEVQITAKLIVHKVDAEGNITELISVRGSECYSNLLKYATISLIKRGFTDSAIYLDKRTGFRWMRKTCGWQKIDTESSWVTAPSEDSLVKLVPESS